MASEAYVIGIDYGSDSVCLKEFNWTKKVELQGKLIDGRYHGIAVGCFIEGGAAGPKETAKLAIEADGSVTVYVGSSAIGQGLETVFSQIAADAIELPLERVRVLHGSTTFLKDGYGSYHSRAVVMGGSAILSTATTLRDELRKAAAARFGCAPGDVTITDEKLSGPGGKSARWADFAGISVDGEFANHHHTYAYGAHAAHITVDAKIGRVEIVDYVAVEDVGRIMNPITMKGQVIGAVVQGLGGTFLEHLAYDKDGQLLAGSFADYLMPTASDFPNIRSFVTSMNCPSWALAQGSGGA